MRKLIFISHVIRFPYGPGAAARMRNYALGLSRCGVEATILCLKPYESFGRSIVYNEWHGYVENVAYFYPCGTTIMENNKFKRILQNMKGIIGAIYYIIQQKKFNNIKALIYYGVSHSNMYSFFGYILSRIAKVPYIGEATEQPFVYLAQGLWKKVNEKIFWQFICKLFDGVIVISKHLEWQFRQHVRKKAQIELIPIMVDVAQYAQDDIMPENLITYCGTFNHYEEIKILLDAWNEILSDFPSYKLAIIGDKLEPNYIKIYQEVLKLRIEDRVLFTGNLKPSELAAFLKKSKVLVLPRENGLFSLAGLPNKLGEYLATGRPVVCTAVGDIPIYIKDKKEAYLVEPGNKKQFIEELKYILNNYEEAKIVGKAGKKAAERFFTIELNCKRLLAFIERLSN